MSTLAASLAVKELRHDWRSTLCFLAALVGVLAPLLIILALKNGVIGGLVDRLVEDPANRELIAVGSGAHPPAFFARLAASDHVGFVVPATRSINASANLVRDPSSRRSERAVPLVPSAKGDPLLEAPPVAPGQAQASAALLDALGVGVGDRVEIVIGRDIDGTRESARAELEIVGAVPAERAPRPALFVALEDLLAVEAFRDDADVTPATWRATAPERAFYASFRLYAADLQDLAGLAADLEREGVLVRPRAENAVLLLGFRRSLTLLYTIIAALAVLGFWAAMAANLRGMVERQRVAFSLLGLVGMSTAERRRVPLFQSLLLVVGGIAATLLLVLPFLALVNRVLGADGRDLVASLGAAEVSGTLLLGLVTAVTAAAWAMAAIGRIGHDEVIRHA